MRKTLWSAGRLALVALLGLVPAACG